MATIKRSPEDFVVDEIPAYEPSGQGDHLYVRFRKRERNTDEVVRDFARALGVPARDIGVAGLKDKVGVTSQTISIPARPELEARVRALALENVELLDARWHKNKLKTGHLRGNRFDIVVHDIDDVDGAIAAFESIAKEGVPNLFGPQRFGPGERNVVRAKAWLSGAEAPPRIPKARRFLFSAWQSAIFNRILERRIADGSWASALEGDLMVKHDSGGMFLCTDVPTDIDRAKALQISATGPMIGHRMRWPEGSARKLEEEVIGAALEELGKPGNYDFLSDHSSVGEGTRRVLRQWVGELQAMREQPSTEGGSASGASGLPAGRSPSAASSAVRVQFVLPSGAYATTVLGRVFPDLLQRAEPPG